MEARGGIEPPIKVLQTFALPLGDRAKPQKDLVLALQPASGTTSQYQPQIRYHEFSIASGERDARMARGPQAWLRGSGTAHGERSSQGYGAVKKLPIPRYAAQRALTLLFGSCTMVSGGRLAQRLERSVYTRKVVRSNRTVPTIYKRHAAPCCLVFVPRGRSSVG